VVTHPDHWRAVFALRLLAATLIMARSLVFASALRLSLVGRLPVAAFFIVHVWTSVGVGRRGRRPTRTWFAIPATLVGIAGGRRPLLAAAGRCRGGTAVDRAMSPAVATTIVTWCAMWRLGYPLVRSSVGA